jgi:RNA polymerase-binding transcription factor DksA
MEMGSLDRMDDTPIDEATARQRLDAERERLEGLVSELRSETARDDDSDEHVDVAGPPGAVTGEIFEREKDLSILEGLELELAEIEAALRRLDDGTYGIDEVTGEPIDPERLEAIPAARTNVDTPRS